MQDSSSLILERELKTNLDLVLILNLTRFLTFCNSYKYKEQINAK